MKIDLYSYIWQVISMLWSSAQLLLGGWPNLCFIFFFLPFSFVFFV